MSEPVHETRPTGEKVLFRARTHAKILVPTVLVQALLLAAHLIAWWLWPESTGVAALDEWGPLAVHSVILVLEVYYVVVPLLRWWHTVFTVTDQRIEMTWGIFTKNARELAISRITQVNVERSLPDRMFGCGTIVLTDAGSPVPVHLADVPRVHHVRQMLDDLRFQGGRHTRRA